MGVFRVGKKFVGRLKRLGHKHKGKIAVVGAIGGAAAFASGAEERVKGYETARAEKIMNTIADENQAEAQEAHDNLMKEKAIPKPPSGFAPKPPKPPGFIQTAKNIPGTLKQAEQSAQSVESAKVLKKSKAIQKGAVDVLGAATAPSKKEKKRVSEEQRYLEGEMSEAEAKAFIKKKGGKAVAKKSKKAAKGAKKRKKKKKK